MSSQSGKCMLVLERDDWYDGKVRLVATGIMFTGAGVDKDNEFYWQCEEWFQQEISDLPYNGDYPVNPMKVAPGERVRILCNYEMWATAGDWGYTEPESGISFSKVKVLRRHKPPEHYFTKARS